MKQTGDVRTLYPEGIDEYHNLPWEFTQCMSHAFRVLQWQENLRKHEMPPDWMLPHTDELEIWFEEVDIARRDEFGDQGGGNLDHDDRENVPQTQNELSSRFKD